MSTLHLGPGRPAVPAYAYLLALFALLAAALQPLATRYAAPIPQVADPAPPAASRPAALEALLGERFPPLRPLLAPRVELRATTYAAGGRTVQGFTAQTGDGPSELHIALPARYGDASVARHEDVEVRLRPVGARSVQGQVEAGRLVYRDVYQATDSLHIVGDGRSKELLVLHDATAPRRLSYVLGPLPAGVTAGLEGGEVVFRTPGTDYTVTIEAPWLMEAGGERRYDLARWELGAPRPDGARPLTLHLATAGLAFPVVVDPSWTVAQRIPAGRSYHTAAKLPDGSVLVVGGFDGTNALASSVAYNPTTDRWNVAPMLGVPRWAHTMTLLPDGRVMVFGGRNERDGILRGGEILQGGRWQPIADPPAALEARYGHTATLLDDGRVLIAGGTDNAVILDSAAIYDPANDSWQALPPMPTRRYLHAANILPDGNVLLSAGRSFRYVEPEPANPLAPTGVLKYAHILDVSAGTWVTATMGFERAMFAAVELCDGSVLVAGGNNYWRPRPTDLVSGTAILESEIFSPTVGAWLTAPFAQLNTQHSNLTLTRLPNCEVIAAGHGGVSTSHGVVQIYNPATNTWRLGDPLRLPRTVHTATLLDDGSVLVVGGANTIGGPPYSSVERYRAGVGTWQPTGRMNDPRHSHSSLVLDDGRVLVVGGLAHRDHTALGTAEIYTPADGTWRRTAAPRGPKQYPALARLPDGRVLVVDGAVAEIYNPATDQWSTVPNSPEVHSGRKRAFPLPDGDVLIVGLGMTPAIERYDYQSGLFARAADDNLPEERLSPVAAQLADGRVLVVGGVRRDQTGLTSGLIFDPADPAGGWRSLPPLPFPVTLGSAALLPDGRLLMIPGSPLVEYGGSPPSQVYTPSRPGDPAYPAGGSWQTLGTRQAYSRSAPPTLVTLPDGSLLTTSNVATGIETVPAERFDAASVAWGTAGTLSRGYIAHAATALPDGSVLVSGGYGADYWSSGESFIYRPAEEALATLAPSSVAHGPNATATSLSSGRVLIVGATGPGAAAEIYDPASGAAATTPMVRARQSHSATLLADGRVLVAGGVDAATGAILDHAEIFSEATGWQELPPMPGGPRWRHSAALLRDGRVLITGGRPSGSTSTSALIFDPGNAASPWELLGAPMAAARFDHSMLLLHDGTVLIAGGNTNSSEIYDPGNAAAPFQARGQIPFNASAQSVTLLADGRVFLAGTGGVGLYDPSRGVWSTTATLPVNKQFASTTTLPDGRVLLAGGRAGTMLPELSLYDPSSNTWQDAGALATARHSHDAVLLPDGRVLLIGGVGNVAATDNLRSVESYGAGGNPADARRPRITTVASTGAATGDPPRVSSGEGLSISGLGLSGAEWAGPGAKALVRLRSLGNGNLVQVAIQPGTLSDTNLTTLPLPAALPPGPAVVEVLVNGVASAPAVVQINALPRLVASAGSQTMAPNSELGLTVTLADAETRAEDLTLSTVSSNLALLDAAGVILGGTGRERTLTLRPRRDQVGLADMRISVSDGLNTTELTLRLNVSDGSAETARWRPVAPMGAPRAGHSLHLLPGGEVLAVGSVHGGASSVTEVYTPDTNTWRVTGTPSSTQAGRAVSLADGRVLRVTDSAAEVYSPEDGRWRVVATARDPALTGGGRSCAALALLRDGRVLMAGGSGAANAGTADAWLFDPADDSWSSTGAMLEPRVCASATTLRDGQVLVAGGTGGDRGATRSYASAELFDPRAAGGAGAFGAAGAMAVARVGHSATLLPDGRVLIAGGLTQGDGGASPTGTAELYNPAAAAGTSPWSVLSFTTPPEGLPARAEHTATLLPDGSVLLAGGVEAAGAPSASAFVVEPANGSWRSAGAMVSPRRGHAAALLPDGRVLFGGGFSSATAESSAEIYDPATSLWQDAPGANLAVAAPVALLLPDGRLFVADSATGAVTLLDAAGGGRQALAALPTPRTRFTATLLAGGKVLVAGGEAGGLALAEALVYDPATPGAAPRLIPMGQARARHTATLLRDGMVLVVGGGSGAASAGLQSAEVFDPTTGQWRPAGTAIGAALQNHTATLLPGGQVLITGSGADGAGQGAASAVSLLYDPGTGEWRRTGDLGFARARHTATLLPSGEVLVAGGYAGAGMATTAEIYSPTAGAWRTVASPAQARGQHSATLLADGSVLIAGGTNGAGAALARAERYEAASNRWLSAGSLAEARFDHGAVTLPDGSVLMLGGSGGSTVRERAERLELSRGFIAARRPRLTGVTPLDAAGTPISSGLLPLGGRLELTGAGFAGGTLGSTGAAPGLPGAMPIVRLQSLAGGQARYLGFAPGGAPEDTSLTTAPLPASFAPGFALATVIVGGVPSVSRIIYVNAPPRIAPIADQQTPMRRVTTDLPFTLTVTVGDAETPLDALRVSARADNDALVPRVEVLPGESADTRILRIITPLEAWGETRVTVRVDDGLSVAERAFGLQVARAAPPWLVLLYLAGDDIPTTLTAGPGDDDDTPPEEDDTVVRGVRTDSLTAHINRLVERLSDSRELPHNEAMRLVVLYDGSRRGDSKILVREPNAEGTDASLVDITCRPRPDGTCDVVRPWPTYPLSRELDTGSTDTLRTFVNWARQEYPGSRYTMLSIVDHGGGWAPDGGTISQPRNSRVWQLGAWRGLNLDYASNSALSTKELGLALAGLPPFDVLFVDACLMGMVEVAHELAVTPSDVPGRPIADYLITGENLLWARLPYENYLHPSNLTAQTEPRQLAEGIVRLYNKVNPSASDRQDPEVPNRLAATENIEPFTIAALDLRAVLTLTPRIEALANELLAALSTRPAVGAAVRAAHREAQKFDYDLSLSLEPNDGYVDLADFADRLALQPALNERERQLAGAISTAVKQSVVVQSRYRNGRIVLPSGTRIWNFERAYGLAIYAPLGEQDCRITGPILTAPPVAGQESQGAFRCNFAELYEHYATVPDAAGGPTTYILVERQLGYYRNPEQLAFSAAAPSWAALLDRLDGEVPARNPDPSDPGSEPYSPPNQIVPGLGYEHRPADDRCMRIPDLDFALEQCLPTALVAQISRLIHTDIATVTLNLPRTDLPLYAWRLEALDAEGTALPQPARGISGTIGFTFTAAFLAEPDIAFERLVVVGWDGRRWATLPALPATDATTGRLVVPLQRFDRYALVSRSGGSGPDNLTAQPQDLLLDPAAPRAGAPVSLALTVRRPSGKTPLENVTVRFAYQYPGEARRTIGETTVPLLAPLSEADTLPLTWTPPISGEVTLIATIDPYLEQPEDDPNDNELAVVVPVGPPEHDAAPPRVAAFEVAGGAPTTGGRTVQLAITGEDPAPSSGIAAMRLIEYRFSPTTGRWRHAQDSGWIPYARTSAWQLDAAPGAAYLQAWVRDGAGQISTYPYRALTNLLPTAAPLAQGATHVYRFTLDAGMCLAASLSNAAGDADLYLWGPPAAGGAPTRWASNLRGADDALTVTAPTSGAYQLEVSGFTAATYALQVALLAPGAPGCATEAAANQGPSAAMDGLDPAKPLREAPVVPLDLLPAEELPASPVGQPVIYLPQVTR